MGKGFSQIGEGGVFRNFDGSYNVIDAKRFSPAQIKELLDQMPFDQRVEDKFRDVDGRGVSEEQVWNPREGVRPRRLMKEEEQDILRKIEEQRSEGIVKDASLCGVQKSNYNLEDNQT